MTVIEALIKLLVIEPAQHATRPLYMDRIDGLLESIGAFVRRVYSSTPSPGYEPMFIKLGYTLFVARGSAYLLQRRGYRTANDRGRLPAVVKAIQFFAKRHRRKPSILLNAELLLAACRETSVVETIFADAGRDVFEFIKLLQSAAEGDSSVHGRLCDITAAIAPHLRAPPGAKVRAASAAHEFLLEEFWHLTKTQGWTWDPIKEDFTDKLTKATRIEFNDPNFDPRPAARRARQRAQQISAIKKSA